MNLPNHFLSDESQTGSVWRMHIIKGRGLRWIAVFEAAKGALVLLLGFGLTGWLSPPIHHMAVQAAHHVGWWGHGHYSQLFIHFLRNTSDRNLWMFVIFSVAYSAIRFVEAYGLWENRSWGLWLAIASVGLYLPFEAMKLIRTPSLMAAVLLTLNVAILIFLIYLEFKNHRKISHVNSSD